MNINLVLVIIILFFFVIVFICKCHKEYFLSRSMIKDDIDDIYPNNIYNYYILIKKSYCIDKDDKNILRDVSEIIDSDRNMDINDIYDITSISKDKRYNMGFW